MNFWRWFVGGFFVLGLGAVGWQALQPAPAQTAKRHSMVPPDTSSIPQGAAIANVILPAEFSPQAQMGQRAFEAKCASCHGENDTGQNGVAPPLVHNSYEPNHHSDATFLNAAQNGVRSHHWNFGNMPPVEGLTQGDVKMIAGYVRELQRANGIN